MKEGHDVAWQLAESADLRAMMKPDEVNENDAALGFLLLYMLFVVCHELGHHLAGHVDRSHLVPVLWEEGPSARKGLQKHANEAVADGIASHFVLAGMLNLKTFRDTPAALFRVTGHNDGAKDRALVTALVASIGAFFLKRSSGPTTAEQVLHRTHPAPVTRMVLVAQHVLDWFEERKREDLIAWLNQATYQPIVDAAATAIGASVSIWQPEVIFGLSPAGAAYLEALRVRIDAQRKKKPTGPSTAGGESERR